MLDFTRVQNKELTLAEMTAGMTVSDLVELTDEMIDTILSLIEGCTDEDVVFEPEDPQAYDAAAADGSETAMAWTLGHVIVHTTASAEESAFLAAEMARGVERHGRSRYETPWETVMTIRQCRERLEESRRMRLASLQMWPDAPQLDIAREYSWVEGSVNAPVRFVMGLWHEADHLGQVADIVNQTRARRVAA